MRIVLVGKEAGRAVVRWPQVMALGFVLSMVIGLGTGSVYYVLAGRWSHLAVLWGILCGVLMVMGGVVRGLKTPLDKLQPLDG